jgi:Na+/H+ antiporter NhaD/arsenite permease-like protein
MFFIAVGDVGRAPIVHNFMNMLGSTSFGTYLSGLAVSQVISNVPAVIILAPYTKYVYPLFLGVNIGGLGTLIASLANLLAYKQYYERAESPSGAYFKIFLQINILFLLILGVVGFFLVFFQ